MKILLSNKFQINLYVLTLFLVITSSTLIVISTLNAASNVQKKALIKSTLETNRVYAEKISNNLGGYINDSKSILINEIENFTADTEGISELTRRIYRQNNYFNSVFKVDNTGKLESIWPENLKHMEGKLLRSAGNHMALAKQKPLISPPYISTAGNLMIQISYPVFDSKNQYQGYLGGSIYLHDSPLQRIMEKHPFKNGTYVYVVDFQGRLIYHPKNNRIGDNVKENPVVYNIMQGESGNQRVINTKGIDMLAGYSSLPNIKWGIVVQRPTKETLASLSELMDDIIKYTFLLLVLLMPLLWWMVRLISNPLQKLSNNSKDMGSNQCVKLFEHINCWYYESQQIKSALLLSVPILQKQLKKLKIESEKDPLTDIYNRRYLNKVLQKWLLNPKPFSAIALDIDFFKRVNDTYGHAQGDRVIKEVSVLLKKYARSSDIICRTGGEEFLLLLPNVKIKSACTIAERLRKEVASQETLIPNYKITISLGVANYKINGEITPEDTLIQADRALYEAKRSGRNKVVSIH